MAATSDTLRQLRDQVRRGETLRAAAATVGWHPSTVCRRLQARYPRMHRRRQRRLTPEQRAAIRSDVDEYLASFRQLAKRHGVSVDTVSRIAHQRDREEGYQHRSVGGQHSVRCPHCRAKITIVPCVRCTALGVATSDGH